MLQHWDWSDPIADFVDDVTGSPVPGSNPAPETVGLAARPGLYYVCAMNLNWPLAGGLLLSLAACIWLYSENQSLSAQLADARSTEEAASAARPAAAPIPAPTQVEAEAPAAAKAAKSDNAKAQRRGFMGDRGERPALPEASEKETRQERRKRRMNEVTALFGRLDGETEDEYRERMVPFLETTLAIPRNRVEDARRAAEQAAGVTDEQRAELDTVFQDAFSEALALTNRAIQSGDLSPYRRNWSGTMNVAGGLGAVLEGTEGRIGEILSAEQMQTIYEQGFEWGEYLGVSVPWEQLQPPPPPPGG